MSHRYFKVETNVLNNIRTAVMDALDQPNGRADEPWPEGGTFNDGTHGYVALGEHHLTGEFAPLVEQFIGLSGVEEIDEESYLSAMPDTIL